MLAEIMELKRPGKIAEIRLENPLGIQGMREGMPVVSKTFSVRHSNSIMLQQDYLHQVLFLLVVDCQQVLIPWILHMNVILRFH